MYYIGVDLGGTNIAVGIVDENYKIIGKKSVKTFNNRPFTEIVHDMAVCIKDLISSYNISEDEIVSVGIGAPGSLDTENGVMVYANNFKDGTDIHICEMLQKEFNKPAHIGNDANVAALGEALAGAAKGRKNCVMITLGTGVGGGIIIDGKIYEGYRSAGAEIGHIVLIKDGEKCTCGRNGCWEAYASATALVHQTKTAIEKHPESIMAKADTVNGRTAFEAARKDDIAGQEVVKNYIEYIAEGLIDIVNVFRPEVIIIGGGICNEGDYLLNPLKDYVNKYSYGGKLNPQQEIVTAQLGNDAGIIGAAFNGI